MVDDGVLQDCINESYGGYVEGTWEGSSEVIKLGLGFANRKGKATADGMEQEVFLVGTFGGVLEGNLLDGGFLEVEDNVPEEAEVEGFFTETGASKSVDSDDFTFEEKTYGAKDFQDV